MQNHIRRKFIIYFKKGKNNNNNLKCFLVQQTDILEKFFKYKAFRIY